MGDIVLMKTTIEISDHLLNRVKELAREERTTLRELAEEGLEMVLASRATRKSQPVRPVTFKGRGLAAEFRGKSWTEIRDEIYKGYGT